MHIYRHKTLRSSPLICRKSRGKQISGVFSDIMTRNPGNLADHLVQRFSSFLLVVSSLVLAEATAVFFLFSGDRRGEEEGGCLSILPLTCRTPYLLKMLYLRMFTENRREKEYEEKKGRWRNAGSVIHCFKNKTIMAYLYPSNCFVTPWNVNRDYIRKMKGEKDYEEKKGDDAILVLSSIASKTKEWQHIYIPCTVSLPTKKYYVRKT